VRDVLKQQKVSLVTYVPDNVLRPLIELIESIRFSRLCHHARGGGAGIVAGAWMGGVHGIVLMQTSGSPHCRTRSHRWRCRSKSRSC